MAPVTRIKDPGPKRLNPLRKKYTPNIIINELHNARKPRDKFTARGESDLREHEEQQSSHYQYGGSHNEGDLFSGD